MQEEYTTKDIATSTKLPMEELKKYMQTLAMSKYTILIKSPKTKEILDTDVFTFNRKFTDRQRKIKMSLLVTKVGLAINFVSVPFLPISCLYQSKEPYSA